MVRIARLVFQFLLYCWFGFWVAGSFLTVFPLLAVLLSRTEWYPYALKVRRKWFAFGLFCGGVRVETIFEEPLTETTYVITPNHTSKLDMMVLPTQLSVDFNFAADKAFEKIPLFGLFLKTIDVPVNLKSKRSAALAFKQGVAQLVKGQSLGVFPEGTIARMTPRLSPFKNGAFKMAIVSKRPILPVTFIHTWELLPDAGPLQFRPGKVIMYVHAPIQTKNMLPGQTDELRERVRRLIANKLKEHGYDPD